VRQASRFNPELWLTTEKDWVRLPQVLPEEMELWVLAGEIDLDQDSSQLAGAVRRVLSAVNPKPEDAK
jgi:tetraacyldisaccharide-1-P 4'-kinase